MDGRTGKHPGSGGERVSHTSSEHRSRFIPAAGSAFILARMTQNDLMVAIETGRKTFLAVFKRARTCTNPKCRRKGFCHVGWWSPPPPNPFHHPTGSCPVMEEAEWKTIALGITRNWQRLQAHYKVLDAREAAAGTVPEKDPYEHLKPQGSPPMGLAQILFSEPTDTGYDWPPDYELGWQGWYERQFRKMAARKRG